MTEAELRSMELRAEKATPGPWWIDGGTIENEREIIIKSYADAKDVYVDENGHFIAHAREDVSTLIAEVRKLREMLELYQWAAPPQSMVGGFCPCCKRERIGRHSSNCDIGKTLGQR